MNRGLPAPLLVKYFEKWGVEWKVKEDIKKMVEFFQINLATPWPSLPLFDVIFLRNVMIYFDVPTKKEILGRARQVLRPDGFLFLGGAESTFNLDDAYERCAYDKGGCYRLAPPKGGIACNLPNMKSAA
jgi:chemotaxis protein methyltransferase CheR